MESKESGFDFSGEDIPEIQKSQDKPEDTVDSKNSMNDSIDTSDGSYQVSEEVDSVENVSIDPSNQVYQVEESYQDVASPEQDIVEEQDTSGQGQQQDEYQAKQDSGQKSQGIDQQDDLLEETPEKVAQRQGLDDVFLQEKAIVDSFSEELHEKLSEIDSEIADIEKNIKDAMSKINLDRQ